ncbi:hypothetical protein GN958_ATG10653 [Phytophthora infestans]|uniref:RING-type domain-containing protein n=1 Tax=Phytophthora infestans TaxID=4787 RepID=A0A8S9UPD6_PHYIN|nr:hypothetical protein GN958_ATG10653 [Phytophthora infestans]
MATPRLRSSRCSGCSGEFFWSSSASQPNNLFPLLCGEVFCRSCLAQKARAVLSTRAVPLRCCENVVPHDFIHEVLDHEEDVYYALLLQLPYENDGVTKVDAKAASVSIPAGLRAQLAEAKAAIKRGSKKRLSSTLNTSAAQQPRHRYLTRSTKARLATELESTDTTPADIEQETAPSPARKHCRMCGIRVTESLLQAPCGDKLCRKCVETGARRYLVSDPKDNRVPASCCGTVLPLDLVLRVISDTELTTYAKRLVKYVDATKDLTTPSTRGTKRKAASEKKSTVSARATKGSKGKAPAKRAKKAAKQKQEQERVCVACYSDATPPGSLMIVPCGHAYCLSCLAIMAKTSLTDRSQVPIRCCSKEFPVEYADQVLTKLEFEQYKSYLAECTPKKSSLLSDRVYTAVVRENGGKQCPQCGVGVIKIAGCDYMTCPLRHSFSWI